MSSGDLGTASTPPGPRIGADEWVASVGARRSGGGPGDRLRRELERIPQPLGFAIAAAVAATLPFITQNGYVLRISIETLTYMLLAIGLNVVVGWAGMLDLGYVAFYGFGAYGYAMLSSSQFNVHWPTFAVIPLITLATVALGFVVALPSRRLSGDYLAIVTLFFGQLFVTVTDNGQSMSLLGFSRDVNVTNGPNGIANVDPFHLFGHNLEQLQGYYWVALGFFVAVLAVLYLVSTSRTGRAWRSLREDPLAAELMGMPVDRLKLMAFAFGAGVAGLTGTFFASLSSAVFSSDFDTPTLIIIYAIVILGGAGSLWGVILGALVVNLSLEELRNPNHATLVLLTLIAATMLAKLRPWRSLALVVAATALIGIAAREIAGAIWPFTLHSQGAITGSVGTVVAHWLPIATNYHLGDYAFCALIGMVLVLTSVKGIWRHVVLAPTLVLAIFNWDSYLAFESSITRLIFVGVLLIVLMNARPQGLLGTTRVEIV